MDHSQQPSFDYASDTLLANDTVVNNATSLAPTPHNVRLCLVAPLHTDPELHQAAATLRVPVVTSETGLEFVGDEAHTTVFVLHAFGTPQYDALHAKKAKILGAPALLSMARSDPPALVHHSRPVYCHLMRSHVCVFTGFKRKERVGDIMRHIHWMGGHVKNEMNNSITHLIAVSSMGEKYQYAFTFNIPIMDASWVTAAWESRDDPQPDLEALRKNNLLGIFQNLRVVLVGFTPDDEAQMTKYLEVNKGRVTDINDQTATHVVIEDQVVKTAPENCPKGALVVKAKWFWVSIQMTTCANENMYLYNDPQSLPPSSGGKGGTPRTPGGSGGDGMFSQTTPRSRSNRRKRARESLLKQLASDDSPCGGGSLPASKRISSNNRRSSVADILSYMPSDSSLLDDSQQLTPQSSHAAQTPLSPPNVDFKGLTPRQRVFHELVKTECNYVGILETIDTVIKQPLEQPDILGGPMLDGPQIHYIFGNLPPIQAVHTNIRNSLLRLAHSWSDQASIGEILLRYCDDLEKAYPPFVNYFENVKKMLDEVSGVSPRFHAFLKIVQSKPECGRQTFQELLIRPVQRLPSMSLLLSDILKHTDKSHSDHEHLSVALDRIKRVMTFVNDNKRQTEAKLKLFEIHNDIENCPADLIASHRTYVCRADVTELSDVVQRGSELTLFVFNDMLEIVKRKGKYNSLKSPGRTAPTTTRTVKAYKHVDIAQLAHIKRIVDITETDQHHQVFALVVRQSQELKERLLAFSLASDDPRQKASFLNTITKTVLNVACRNDAENFLVSMDPHHLDIDMPDTSIVNALSKALKFASRTTRKVSRAFSFNKSPGGKLKRAVSTVMSPFAPPGRGEGGVGGLRGAASVTNLAELGTPPPLGPPLTPRSSRRPLKNL